MHIKDSVYAACMYIRERVHTVCTQDVCTHDVYTCIQCAWCMHDSPVVGM
jgi:hypothetical protein